MDIVIKVLQFLMSLSLLVLFHEFGHFIFAKIFKVRVEKFYMFFNPWFSLFKFKKGETEYGIGWLPLGGYVKIAGMIDESMDTEQMKHEPQSWEFRSKPAWQRLLIMIGGVLVNVILAYAIYIGILCKWGETYLPNENITYGVVCDPMFQQMGMENGDIIVGLDGKTVERFDEIIPQVMLNTPKTMQVKRNGEVLTLSIPSTLVPQLLEMSSKSYKMSPLLTPRMAMNTVQINSFAPSSLAFDAGIREGDQIIAINGQGFNYYDQFTTLVQSYKGQTIETTIIRSGDTLNYPIQLGAEGLLGIYYNPSYTKFDLVTQHYNFFQAIPAGIKMGNEQISSYIKQLKLLFSHKEEAYKSVGGMASIANIFPAHWNWLAFWNLTALLSIMLAVVNILPIPALDGGHVLFLLYEVVTRRKPSEKFLERAQMVGMVFVFGLFILANVNDIIKFFGS
ncbi:MAG: RIP metalloprotease RseP [Marinifilaceae bacterium]